MALHIASPQDFVRGGYHQCLVLHGDIKQEGKGGKGMKEGSTWVDKANHEKTKTLY